MGKLPTDQKVEGYKKRKKKRGKETNDLSP
jgi:hypothetical protein